jgi:hypothetical protein
MKKYIVSLLMLTLLLFPASCQQRKVVHIPVTPPTTAPEKQNEKPVEISENKNEQTEQTDQNKFEWYTPEYKPLNRDFPLCTTRLVSDPYQVIWNYDHNNYKDFLGRYYEDLDDDLIPELFLTWSGGTCAASWFIYKITNDGYLLLGNLDFWDEDVLDEKHFGYKNIMTFTRTGSLEDGDEDGFLTLIEFDGKEYVPQKRMDITLNQSKKRDLFHLNNLIIAQQHPEGDKLLWSPNDDDKYRRMIK